MSQKIAAAMPVRAADKQAPAQYIRYVLEFKQFHHHFSTQKMVRIELFNKVVRSYNATLNRDGHDYLMWMSVFAQCIE